MNSVIMESTAFWFRSEVDNKTMKLGAVVMVARKTER